MSSGSVVKDELRFETYNDFYIRRKIIKDNFERICTRDKEVYKYYLYANDVLTTPMKDLIWSYLVEPIDSPFYVFDRDLHRYYSEKAEKRMKKSDNRRKY